jgi:hypothetical protein
MLSDNLATEAANEIFQVQITQQNQICNWNITVAS